MAKKHLGSILLLCAGLIVFTKVNYNIQHTKICNDVMYNYLLMAADKAEQFDFDDFLVTTGLFYVDGNTCNKNYEKAKRLFEMAAEHENAGALYHLGYLYENGLGVVKNKPRAMCYYSKAASLGLAKAQDHMLQIKAYV